MMSYGRFDAPIGGVPAEFTVANAMVPALYAGACQALAQAAICGSVEDGRSVDPTVILRAQIEEELWLGVARYEQRLASGSYSLATSKAARDTPNSSYSIRSR